MSTSSLVVLPSYTAADCEAGVLKYAGKSAWACIGMGLFFLKAHEIFVTKGGRPKKLVQKLDEFSGTSETSEIAIPDESATTPDFDQFLANVFFETPFTVSRTTAYNYMRAARRLGLTADSMESDLEALQAANALQGRRLSQLYVRERTEATESQKTTPPDDPGQLWLDFDSTMVRYFAPEAAALRALNDVPIQQVEAVQSRLRLALSHITEALDARRRGDRR